MAYVAKATQFRRAMNPTAMRLAHITVGLAGPMAKETMAATNRISQL